MSQRRRDAIMMLTGWWNAEDTARGYEALARGPRPEGELVNPLIGTAKVLRKEADDLREPILMLMGVDDTPLANLEVVDGPTSLADLQFPDRADGETQGAGPDRGGANA